VPCRLDGPSVASGMRVPVLVGLVGLVKTDRRGAEACEDFGQQVLVGVAGTVRPRG
jgi:hypothetical protein